MPTGASDAPEAAPGLAPDFLELKRIHRAHQADLQLADLTLKKRAEAHAMKAQIFVNTMGYGVALRTPKIVAHLRVMGSRCAWSGFREVRAPGMRLLIKATTKLASRGAEWA